jgi:predicted transcriptional regulator of viral defense system
MSRPLSPLESKLILHLEWEKQPTVTIKDTMQILDCSYDHARQILHRLVKHQWLSPIAPGKYEFIPANRGVHAFADPNPCFVGSTLVKPYYFSYATAAYFYGLTTQASALVYIATNAGRARRLSVREKDFQIVVQPVYKFFGAVEVDAYGSRVLMADLEKTLVDCLDRPLFAGGVPEVTAMLWRGKDRFDWNRLTDYGLCFQSQSLIQRLGYLIDTLHVPVSQPIREKLIAQIGQSTSYLDRRKRRNYKGEYHATWHIVDNVPHQELVSEIEVR